MLPLIQIHAHVFLILLNKFLKVGENVVENWFVWAIILWFFFFVLHFINVFVTHRLFGKDWELAGRYSEIMSPWLMVNLLVSPISHLPVVLGKLKPFFGLGYAFFSSNFKYENASFDPSDPAFMTVETKLSFNGLTINPGLKYHISDLLFVEGSYKYFPVNSDDIEGTANTHFIYLGLGFKF